MQNFLLLGMDDNSAKMADFILAVAFASSSVTIVSGAMAERCKLPAYFFFSCIMGGITYPLVAHWYAASQAVVLLVSVLFIASAWLRLIFRGI
jgi:ammonia channel protein AmtB